MALAVIAGTNWYDRARAEAPEVAGPPIEYDHLSNEEIEPYGSRGVPPQRPEEKRAVRRFSDVRDCLVKEEQDKDIPDLRKIDWRRMTSTANIRVCLFRIFASYGTPEKAVLWFQAQGLETTGPIEGTYAFKPTVNVSGRHAPTEDGRLYVSGSPITARIAAYLIYSEGFAASWDENGILTTTSHSQSSK
ncbi:MAG TPA: hypothetical protein ENJ91_04685 [Rhodobacteraceae bacterium]|nr:hypothetical protein [Paracoccaceae bacterium]